MLPRAILVASLAGLSHQANAPRAATNSTLDPLKLNENGTFRISVFSDLHFGQSESGRGPLQDRSSQTVMGTVLDHEPSNLVVLNGDLINGDTTYLHNSTDYVDQVVGPLVERNLTWASTYGNHDHNYNISGQGILAREYRWPGARTQKMVSGTNAGITNYYLPVYPANCADSSKCTPELLLWFFDSRGGFYFQGKPQPSWVDKSVVRWFNKTSAALSKRYQKVIPSLAFVHIPIKATEVFQANSGVDPHHQPGINDEKPTEHQGGNWCSDGKWNAHCAYGGQDVPFMRALVSTPGLMGLFYGHNHGLSWCFKWDTLLPGMTVAGNGLNLCYGQHSGYGGGGNWIRGGRVIEVTRENLAEFVVDTHIRLESGDVVGAVSLNSTFNKDYYPATPNQMTYLNKSVDKKVKVYPSSASSLRDGLFSVGVLQALVASLGLWSFVGCTFWVF